MEIWMNIAIDVKRTDFPLIISGRKEQLCRVSGFDDISCEPAVPGYCICLVPGWCDFKIVLFGFECSQSWRLPLFPKLEVSLRETFQVEFVLYFRSIAEKRRNSTSQTTSGSWSVDQQIFNVEI